MIKRRKLTVKERRIKKEKMLGQLKTIESNPFLFGELIRTAIGK